MGARHVAHNMAWTAMRHNCVVFNLDYRLAPEHKCPGGQEDFVDFTEFILANAERFRISPDRVCISGCSGGGWIVLGAANLMVKKGTIGKIRAMFIHTGMVSNEA